MRAFIIRPFGIKQDGSGNEIDFERVERDLIGPALATLGYEGRTTQDIARAGNIRSDMFRLLVTADLVVADLSIHNANVFYELGIRHALRDKRTHLIRCKADATIFDLQTDRYLQYDRDDPAASLAALIDGLRQTTDSTEQDSPVFRLLPDLREHRRSVFLVVPPGFRDEVERAAEARRAGDLELLGAEARGFEWESEGLRVVGRTQFGLGASEGARVTWESVRQLEGEGDLEANTLLGTIYQRLGDPTRSDQAVRRALERKDSDAIARAELQSLLARNAKTRWIREWEGGPPDERPALALASPLLEEAARLYMDGFAEHLNHVYPGLNALAMLTIQADLSAALPDVWAGCFADDDEADRARQALLARLTRLAAVVEASITAARKRLEREQKEDVWIDILEAGLRCLTATVPRQVGFAYRKALANAPDFAVESARKQLELYRDLGVRKDIVESALAAFPPAPPAVVSAGPRARPRVLLFTGHVIDTPDRTTRRFPPDMEGVARQAIRDAVVRELEGPGGIACGIAGGASGGDILFHEVCGELNIPTELYLAMPRERFVPASVTPAGAGWIDRFDRQYERLPRRVLLDSEELPRWLREKPGYGIWQRDNLWMLHNALALGRDRVTVIALWDGESGDGPGGTGDLVSRAKASGAKPIILDTKTLFGLTEGGR